MNDQQFDKIIKDKLDALEAPFDAGSWDLLAQRMDAPYSQEYPEAVADVDKAVYRNLQQMEVPFEPAHWAAMEQRLHKVKRTGRVLWIKLAEAAVFLLLVAYVGGWLYSGAHRNAPIRAKGPVAFLYEQVEATGAHEVIPPMAGAAKHKTGILIGSLERPLHFTPEPVANTQGLLPQVFPMLSSLQNEPAIFESGSLHAATVATAALLPVSNPDFLKQTPLSAAGLNAANPVIQPAPRTRHFYAFAMVSADRNQAVAGNYTHRSNGYSAGYGAGYRNQKWGLELGALYADRSFDPKKSVVLFDGNIITGYYGSNLRTVEADMLSVPVKATRRVFRAGKAEVHAVAGATAHLALQKSYQYETIYFPGQSPSALPVIPASQRQELRPKAKGLLEGGTLSGNAYLSADAGLRLEYPISKKYTAFVEPAYRRAFGNGFGPKATSVNTVSVSAGVITTI